MRDDELLRLYLLGDLSEEETEAVERRLLQEDDLSELAEAVESEILEAYAKGELSPERRARVDRFLASSSSGRLRLAVLKGLATLAPMASITAEPTVPSKVLPFPRPDLSRPLHRFAAIAAMLAIAVASFLLIPIRPDLPDQTATVPASPQPPPARRVPVARPAPTLDKPGPVLIAETIAETPQPIPTPSPSPSVVVIQLALSVARDAGQEALAFAVPADQIARLQIQLRERDKNYSSYQVILKDGLDEETQHWESLQPTPVNGEQILVVQVPAGQLQEGRYTATIQGITPEGDVANLAFPEFQVRQP